MRCITRTSIIQGRRLPSVGRVYLGLPGEDWFAADLIGAHGAVAGHLAPGAAGRSTWPIRDHVFGAWIGQRVLRGKVREICDHHHRILTRLPPFPDQHALVVVEVHVKKLTIINAQRWVTGAEVDEARDIVQDLTPPRLVRATEVNRIDLLAATLGHVA